MSVTFTTATFQELTDTDGVRRPLLVMGPDHSHRSCTDPNPCEDFAIYTYCDHIEAAEAACGCRSLEVNVSNANAVAILERLGYDHDPDGGLVGDATPDDILGRAMVANVGRDDTGTATVTDRGLGGATMIDCGVRPGYYDARMSAIIDLATAAKARGVMVAWA